MKECHVVSLSKKEKQKVAWMGGCNDDDNQ